MPGLRELQIEFANALFDSAATQVEPYVLNAGIDSAGRIEIYRNNLREGFIKALALGFPVIEKLVGENYFRQMALDFLHVHPSRAGNLHHIGAPLAEFLRERFAQTEYAYLADVAALEWAHQQALVAPDAPALSPESFRDLDPESYAGLHLHLHPACALVRSAFPVVRIWRANQSGSADEGVIDIGSGGENILVLRTPECIEFHRIPGGEFAALAAFDRGEDLITALEAALAADPEFNISAALQRFVSLQLLTH